MKSILEAAKDLVEMIEEKENEAKNEKRVRLSELQPGENFETSFGEMLVLSQDGDHTKVITKGYWGSKQIFDNESPDYKNSEVEKMLKNEVLGVFKNEFGADNIIRHTVPLTTVDMQEDFGTYTGKIRLLTFDEAREFNALLVNKELNGYYWTLTPWSTKERGWEYSVAVVSPQGIICGDFCDYDFGARPVCIFSSSIFESEKVEVIEQ